jgi:hypothetical protein
MNQRLINVEDSRRTAFIQDEQSARNFQIVCCAATNSRGKRLPMGWSGRAPPRQRSKLARGAEDKEHAMANMPPCVIGMEACVSASKRDPQRPKGANGASSQKSNGLFEGNSDLRSAPPYDTARPFDVISFNYKTKLFGNFKIIFQL